MATSAEIIHAAQRIGAQLPGPPPWLPEAPKFQCPTLPKVDRSALWPGQLQRLVRRRTAAAAYGNGREGDHTDQEFADAKVEGPTKKELGSEIAAGQAPQDEPTD
jgi:hypothetical protein